MGIGLALAVGSAGCGPSSVGASAYRPMLFFVGEARHHGVALTPFHSYRLGIAWPYCYIYYLKRINSYLMLLVNGKGKAHTGCYIFSGAASYATYVHGDAPHKMYTLGTAICHPYQFVYHKAYKKGELYHVNKG